MAEAIYNEVDRSYGPIGRVLENISRIFAICAGVTLSLMAVMSLASVAGRALFDKPITGDYELVQLMSAIAVALSLPFCQMMRGHIIVDFFTANLPSRINSHLDLIANFLLAIGAFVFSWRLAVGMLDLRQSGDASMLLNLPTWYGYLPMVPSFFLLGCASLYIGWIDYKGAQA